MRTWYSYNYGSFPGHTAECTFNYILSNEDDVTPLILKRTCLYEGDKERSRFGDNEVTHYKMTVAVNPQIEETIPELQLKTYHYYEVGPKWSGGHQYFDTYMYDGRGGVNTLDVYRETGRYWPDGSRPGSTYAQHYHIDWEWNPTQRRFSFVKKTLDQVTIREYSPGYSYGIEAKTAWGYTPPYLKGGNVEEIIWHTVALPYYWIDHFNEVLAEESVSSDSEALPECIRNVIQEETTYDTNGYANIISFLDMIKDARDLSVLEVINEAKPLWKTILEATGNAVDDLSDTKMCKKAARKALRKRSKDAAANAWLTYRYVYNTTKSDYEQFVRAKVGEYLGALDQNRVLRGSIKLSGGLLKVKMRLTDNTKPNFEKFLINANQYGLFPGLYNLWDMIPFSFIADWFAPLGDELQDIDQSIFFRYYEVNELLVSRKLRYERKEPWGQTTYEYYERRQYDAMPQWEIYEDPKGTSGRTIFKRCLDGISIISGFV